jgi:hypothetical protein
LFNQTHGMNDLNTTKLFRQISCALRLWDIIQPYLAGSGAWRPRTRTL